MNIQFAEFFPRIMTEFEKVFQAIAPAFDLLFEKTVWEALTVLPDTLPDWLVTLSELLSSAIQAISPAIPDFLDTFTFFELIFGGGLSIILLITIVKWFIGVVWG